MGAAKQMRPLKPIFFLFAALTVATAAEPDSWTGILRKCTTGYILEISAETSQQKELVPTTPAMEAAMEEADLQTRIMFPAKDKTTVKGTLKASGEIEVTGVFFNEENLLKPSVASKK